MKIQWPFRELGGELKARSKFGCVAESRNVTFHHSDEFRGLRDYAARLTLALNTANTGGHSLRLVIQNQARGCHLVVACNRKGCRRLEGQRRRLDVGIVGC